MVLFAVVTAFVVLPEVASAQQQMSPEEREKKMYEALDTEISRLEQTLHLDDWQLFMVDSIYTHDYMAMMQELQDLQGKKVSNNDIYNTVQDKWMEAMYQAFSKVLDEDQWTKYLKSGAARSKKARDKRQENREKNSTKVKK